ncbi:hypothetical protein [Roseomonas chloroacetimidivorans]|uniref:hypothetical protein n=1 Tax=Roseomonas chloroacetimidivorans TaxID=1766656 RepID=UPI003C76F3F6
MAVILGTFTFADWELPEVMPFGGAHLLRRHRLIGGKKVIDALGPDDAPLSWRGRFRGPLAALRARQLDTMRRAGQEHVLSWDTFAYRVVIERFEADYERFSEIPYRIACEVIEDLVAGEVGELLTSVEDAVAGDLAAALGLAADSPVVTGTITAAQAAINSVATNGTLSFSTISGAAFAGVQGGFASSIASSGSVAAAASKALDGTPLAGVLSGPASEMAGGVQSIVQAGELAWKASGVQSLLTRAAANLVRA